MLARINPEFSSLGCFDEEYLLRVEPCLLCHLLLVSAGHTSFSICQVIYRPAFRFPSLLLASGVLLSNLDDFQSTFFDLLLQVVDLPAFHCSQSKYSLRPHNSLPHCHQWLQVLVMFQKKYINYRLMASPLAELSSPCWSLMALLLLW